MAAFGSVVCCFLALLVSSASAEHRTVDIMIPNSAWDGTKTVQCTAISIEPNQYITSFVALHRKKTARHISIVTCDEPYSTNDVWDCLTPGKVCPTGKSEALWAMSKEAPGWQLPKDYGIPLGTEKRYLIVQIHVPVGMTFETTPDFNSSGMRINITDEKPKYSSALAAYGNVGHIPARTTGFTADSACRWPYSNTPLHAINIHSHTMATAISGYIYRNNEWIELLRADPVYPEPIIDIRHRNITLQDTDYVVMRCTLTNPTDEVAMFGFKHSDQMCNLYLYYGIPDSLYNSIHPVICAHDAQSFSLDDYFDMPEDSTLPDKEGYAQLLAPYHVSKIKY